jgi:predicted DCC family thiol-disulfide oxidoreductase YuxK
MAHAASLTSLWPAQVFFDGACPLCSREIAAYRKRDRDHRLHFIDIADPAFHAVAYGLDPQRVQEVMHVRTADGTVQTEVAAFRILWQALPPNWLTSLLLMILRLPGMMTAAGVAYRVFARNRYRLTGRCTPASCPPRA